MTTFVLVHGAWHGAWCWARVAPLLEAHGHRVMAPDLPGMGQDQTPPEEVSLEGWAEFVAGCARDAGERVVLVGHSRGGVVVSQAAELAPDAVAGLVYVTAILLSHGGTVMQLAGDMPPDGLAAMRMAADGLSSTLDLAAAGQLMYGQTPAPWLDWALAQLGPDPSTPNQTPVRLSAGRFGTLPRAYVECLRDRTLPIELQRAMQLQTPCDPVFGLDTDHSPFLSAPKALCDVLLEAAAGMQL